MTPPSERAQAWARDQVMDLRAFPPVPGQWGNWLALRDEIARAFDAFAAEAVQAVDQAWRTAAWKVHQPPTQPSEAPRPCPLCDLMLAKP